MGRRFSSKISIPESIELRVEANLSGIKYSSPGVFYNIKDDDTEVVDIEVDFHEDDPGVFSAGALSLTNATNKFVRRGQIIESHPEKSDSAKKIQKIVRGKLGRKKAQTVAQLNQKIEKNHKNGGTREVTHDMNVNVNQMCKEGGDDMKYLGLYRKKNGSAKTIQKFLRQASFRRRRRRQEAAGTLTLGKITH